MAFDPADDIQNIAKAQKEIERLEAEGADGVAEGLEKVKLGETSTSA